MVSGRMFRPGTFEVIVGQSAARQFGGLDVGARLRWGNANWEVVGVFADNGSVSQGELWADATILQGAYNRGTSYQSLRVQLTGASCAGDLPAAR